MRQKTKSTNRKEAEYTRIARSSTKSTNRKKAEYLTHQQQGGRIARSSTKPTNRKEAEYLTHQQQGGRILRIARSSIKPFMNLFLLLCLLKTTVQLKCSIVLTSLMTLTQKLCKKSLGVVNLTPSHTVHIHIFFFWPDNLESFYLFKSCILKERTKEK